MLTLNLSMVCMSIARVLFFRNKVYASYRYMHLTGKVCNSNGHMHVCACSWYFVALHARLNISVSHGEHLVSEITEHALPI